MDETISNEVKKFYIKTLGCKVNQYESQVIRESFLRSGYIEAGHIDGADICVINTCTVTSTSDSKSLKAIDTAARKKDRCVIATGCMVYLNGHDSLKGQIVKCPSKMPAYLDKP